MTYRSEGQVHSDGCSEWISTFNASQELKKKKKNETWLFQPPERINPKILRLIHTVKSGLKCILLVPVRLAVLPSLFSSLLPSKVAVRPPSTIFSTQRASVGKAAAAESSIC